MCVSTEDYNEWMNEHYEKIAIMILKKNFLNGFIYLIPMNVKKIESLQKIYVSTIDRIEF